jgi:hypothetical protein
MAGCPRALGSSISTGSSGRRVHSVTVVSPRGVYIVNRSICRIGPGNMVLVVLLGNLNLGFAPAFEVPDAVVWSRRLSVPHRASTSVFLSYRLGTGRVGPGGLRLRLYTYFHACRDGRIRPPHAPPCRSRKTGCMVTRDAGMAPLPARCCPHPLKAFVPLQTVTVMPAVYNCPGVGSPDS